MTEIVGVKFRNNGKEYYFNPNGKQIEPGTKLVVETARGMELAECSSGNRTVDETTLLEPLRQVSRVATQADLQKEEQNRAREKTAYDLCEKKIKEYGLNMKLTRVECAFEGNKILFYFTSDERVDFRAMVRDLSSSLHARIELRQIGVRDEARMIGGLGICGRPFCCTMYHGDFQPVSIKMAKTQNLSLNPTKISGTCGRLMCCLRHEEEAYEELVKKVPRVDSFVETPDGAGDIISVNLLWERVRVRLDSAPESPKTYRSSEVRVIRSGKGKRPEDYVEPPRSELEKLRYVPTPEERAREEEKEKERIPGWNIGSDVTEETPEPAPKQAQSEPKQGGSRSGRHRSGRKHGGGSGNGGEAAAAKAAQAQQQKPAEKTAAPEGHKSHRSHRGGRRRGRGGQGGATPPEEKPKSGT